MTEKRIYLAGPYTHALAAVRQARFEALTAEAARLMALGHQVYSPITHGHVIAQAGKLPTSWRYWADTCTGFVTDWAEALVVLMLDGWRTSTGVAAEIRLARAFAKPVYHLAPHTGEAVR